MLSNLNLFKLGLPVRIADELLPASSTQRVPRKCWCPTWLDRNLAQPHVRFVRQVVSLAMVALQTCQNTVRPSRLATSRTRQYVVDGQFTWNRLHTAVLASEPVSLEDVASVECHSRLRQPVKTDQCDNLWNAKTLLNGTDAWIAIGRFDRGPIGPVEQLVRFGINNLRHSAVDHRHRSSDRGDVYWLPASVQHQGRVLQYGGEHNSSSLSLKCMLIGSNLARSDRLPALNLDAFGWEKVRAVQLV